MRLFKHVLPLLALLCAAPAWADASYMMEPTLQGFAGKRAVVSFTAPSAGCLSSLTVRGATPAITRASTGTIQTSATALTTCSAGQFRIDYRGLAIEQASTNQYLQSADVSNAAWSKASTPTVTANQCLAPDGTTTMALVNSETGTNTSALFQTKTITSSTGPFVSQAWVMPSSGSHVASVAVSCTGASNAPVGCSCSVSSGTCLTAIVNTNNCAAYTTASGLVHLAAMSSCTTAATSATGFVEAGQYGTSTDSICIGTAQFELLNLPTSYIATTTTAVTRSADQIDLGAVTLSATPSLSATVNLEGLPASGTATVLDATDGTNSLVLAIDTSGHAKCSYGASSDTTTGTVTPGTASRVVCKYDGATLSACIAGACHGTPASLTPVSSYTHLYVGSTGSAAYLNGFASTICADKRAGGC